MAPIVESLTAQSTAGESPNGPDALMPQPTLSHSLRHPRHDEGSHANAPWKQHGSPMAVAKPEPGSINAILREHCRTRLFVAPIIWTSEQLRLLECRFDFRAVPHPPQEKVDVSPYQRELELLIEINQGRGKPSLDDRADVGGLLSKMGIYFGMDIYREMYITTPFLFGHRRASTIRTDGIFCASSAVTVAYCRLITIQNLRRRVVLGPCKEASRRNFAKLSYREARLRKLQPPDELEDPYIVAVLIALAQQQRQRTNMPAMTFTLILERGFRPSDVYIYQTRIGSEFLDKFDKPSKRSLCDGLQVEYWRVPLEKPAIAIDMFQRLCTQSEATQHG